jgi:hypothetical protein
MRDVLAMEGQLKCRAQQYTVALASMTAVSTAIAWSNPSMFNQSSIQSRADAFGIQKSPIKMKIPSTKPRLCPKSVAEAFSFRQQQPPSFVQQLKPAAFNFASPPTAESEKVTITNGFCAKLDVAARTGDLAAIDACIKQGANINQKSVLSQQSPLIASVQCNQPLATRMLLSKGADIFEVSLTVARAFVALKAKRHSSDRPSSATRKAEHASNSPSASKDKTLLMSFTSSACISFARQSPHHVDLARTCMRMQSATTHAQNGSSLQLQ